MHCRLGPESLRMRHMSLVQTEPTEMFGSKHVEKLGNDGFGIEQSNHMSISLLNDHTFAAQMVVWH